MRKNENFTIETIVKEEFDVKVKSERKKQPEGVIKHSMSNRVEKFMKLYNKLGEDLFKKLEK